MLERGENDSLANSLDDGEVVSRIVAFTETRQMRSDARIVIQPERAKVVGSAHVERRVRPVAWQEGVGQVPVSPLDQDVAGSQHRTKPVEQILRDQRSSVTRSAKTGVPDKRRDRGAGVVETAIRNLRDFCARGGELIPPEPRRQSGRIDGSNTDCLVEPRCGANSFGADAMGGPFGKRHAIVFPAGLEPAAVTEVREVCADTVVRPWREIPAWLSLVEFPLRLLLAFEREDEAGGVVVGDRRRRVMQEQSPQP